MRFALCFAFLSVVMLRAEQPAGNMPAAQAPPQGGSQGSNVIPTFDNGFFNPKPQAPSNVPLDRYGAPEANYNSEQLESWKEICDPEKKKSMQDYRDCFQREKKKTLTRLKQGYEEVERKQAIPLNNVPATVDEFKGIPGGNEND